MSWNALQTRAEQLGFEVELRSRWYEVGGGFMPDLTPPTGRNWIFVGCYDDVAALWVKPLATSEKKLDGNLIRKLMAELDQFVGSTAIADYANADNDFIDTTPLVRTSLANWAYGDRRRFPNQERRCATISVPFERRTPTVADRRGALSSAWARSEAPATMQ